MKILAISGSPRKESRSGVHRLVATVLENSGCESELISLRGKTLGGCIACLGCVKDNVCKVEDDMTGLRGKILAADAYVIGAPNYYSTLNALTHAFLERWFQFRHRAGDALWGKLAVAIGVGGVEGQTPADDIEKFLFYNFVETVAKVTGQGAACCYSCGYGESCEVGIVQMRHGEGAEITDEMIPDVAKQPEAMAAAAEAGKLLGRRLKEGHDRGAVTARMQAEMMARFQESV